MRRFGQISDIDLRLLKTFKVVAEAGGFAAAEVTLNVSRSAISMTISDLEKRLGYRLCQRGRAGFALTDEGQRVYDALLRMLAAMDEFRADVNTMSTSLTGELAIGITDNLVTMPRMAITQALKQLREVGDGVRIQLSMIAAPEVEKAVLDNRLQVGVVPITRQLKGLDYLPLYTEDHRLYCAPGHPLFDFGGRSLPVATLAEHDAVATLAGQTADSAARHARLRVAAEANDREGVAFLLHTGQYIGYLPTHYARQWEAEERLRALPVRGMGYQLQYAAISRREARPNRVVETFLDKLAECRDA